MKIRIKYNLLNDKPDIVELESNNIDELCQKMREVFNESGSFTFAETEDNVLWIEGPETTVKVSSRVKDDNVIDVPQWKKHPSN